VPAKRYEKHTVVVEVLAPVGMPGRRVTQLVNAMLDVGYADAASTVDSDENLNPDAGEVTSLTIRKPRLADAALKRKR
jgi:hypothetical protein